MEARVSIPWILLQGYMLMHTTYDYSKCYDPYNPPGRQSHLACAVSHLDS